MSALGQKQTCAADRESEFPQRAMSALPQKRTCAVKTGMSAMRQNRTERDSRHVRRPPQFCSHHWPFARSICAKTSSTFKFDGFCRGANRLPGAALCPALKRCQRTINAEAAGFLAWREFLEGAKESPDELLRRHHDEQVLHTPAVIVHALVVRGFEGVGPQVEELR